MASTATIYGDTGDGFLRRGYVLHWSEARDGTTAALKETTIYACYVGWADGLLYRSYLYFDTSTIPAAATILSATLKVWLYYEDTVPTGHDIVLYSGQPTYPHSPLVIEDYNRLLYASGGADNLTIWSGMGGLQTFTLNATGRETWINKGGTTKLCLRSEFDVSPTVPGLGMFAAFYTTDKGGMYRPVLTVTYGTKATVTTNAASGIGSGYATGNGTIDDSGSDPITAYGVLWNDDGSDPVDLDSADNHAEGSDLAGGVFTASMTSLTASTDYFYRVYVTNAGGTAYGSAVEFTTAAAPAILTVTTSEATTVADTTAILKGVIVEDAGDTVTQHGFIWKKNSDPLEEASPIHNPTGADNYVLLGTGAEGTFTTGVTGLDTGSVYLVRAFAVTTGATEYGGIRVARTGDLHVDTFYSLPGDGWMYYEGYSLISYDDAGDEAENATTAMGMNTTGTEITLGRWVYPYGDHGYKYVIERGYLYFNTSDLPANATVLSAVASVYVSSRRMSGSNLEVYDGQPTHPTSSGTTPALELDDWDKSEYDLADETHFSTTPGGNVEYPNEYQTICDATSILTIGGLTKIMFQFDSIGVLWFTFNSGNAGANKPKLVVTYSVPGDPLPYPQINVGGVWKEAKNVLIRVGGQWRLATAVQINVGGTWKDAA